MDEFVRAYAGLPRAERLRVIQIVPTVEQEASGPAQSVPRLCAALVDFGCEPLLLSIGGTWFSREQSYAHYVAPRGFMGVPVLQDLWFSAGFRRRLMTEAARAQIVHSHGLWVMPNVYPALAARRFHKPLVLSPRGTLSPVALARSRWFKRIFWALLQGRAVHSTACFHATSEQEYHDIRRLGLRQPIAIVPNGIDLPPAAAKPKNRTLRTLLYLGRIHRIKGIDNLLRAWQRLAPGFPDWQLRLVGPDDGHLAQLEHLARELALPRVIFAGPRYGAEKHAEYAAADVYVLPSHTENFGMSIAEALAHSVPVITTTGTPWRDLRERRCGWLVSATLEDIEGALREALALDRCSLGEMGRAGSAWMKRDFSWSRVACDFEQLYRWILSGGPPPGFVKID